MARYKIETEVTMRRVYYVEAESPAAARAVLTHDGAEMAHEEESTEDISSVDLATDVD